MWWVELFMIGYFAIVALKNISLIRGNTTLECIMPLLLINPFVLLHMKYVNNSVFNMNLIYFNMSIITLTLLTNNFINKLNNICYKCDTDEINSENEYEPINNIQKTYMNDYAAKICFQISILLCLLGAWYIAQTQFILGLICIVLLLKFKTYAMMTKIDEYVHQYLVYINRYDDYCSVNMSYNIDTIYDSINYTYKLCTIKFWIFIGCAYLYTVIANPYALYIMIGAHSLFSLSVLKLHYLLHYNTHSKLNINASKNDTFFMSLV